MRYKQLTLQKRYHISTLLERGYTQKDIAAHIGVHPSTISREIRRNWDSRLDGYLYSTAHLHTQYRHQRRVRSAYKSLKRFLPYLFTYQTHSNLNIPNTTNALDGGCFSPLKDLLRVHRGIGIKMKRKLIVYFLENRVK